MAVQLATAYLAKKNVKGYPDKALKQIGQDLQKFEKNDTDKSGCLDREEVKKMLMKEYVVSKSSGFVTDKDVDDFIAELDDDANGKISKDEWMQKIVLRWANATYIRQLIRFDKDRDGKITRQEIHQGLTDDGYSKDELDTFINDHGLNHDGKVDFKLFLSKFFDINRA